MVFNFIFAFFISLLILFVPGYLTLRIFNFKRLVSLCAAPIVSIVEVAILSLVISSLGFPTTFLTSFIPFPIILFIVCLIVLKKRQGFKLGINADNKFTLTLVFEYSIVAILVGVVYFLIPLSSLDSPSLSYDTLTHYGAVRAFLYTNTYFSITPSVFADMGISDTYYPCGWHMLCAYLAGATNSSISLCANALNFSISTIVFPLGMLLLLQQIFKGSKTCNVFGGLICVSFAPFPWYTLAHGFLFSQLLAFSLLPATMAIFIMCFKTGLPKRTRVSMFALILICVLSSLITQPNFIFSCIVVLFPFCVYKIATCNFKKHQSLNIKLVKLALCLAFTLLCVAVWLLFYNLEFMKETVSYSWYPLGGIKTGIICSLFGSNARTPLSLFLGLASLVGIFSLYFKFKNSRWVLGAYATCIFLFVICVGTDADIRHLLAGFWYTDPMRLASLLSIISIPIATAGVTCIFLFLKNKVANLTWVKFYRATFFIVTFLLLFSPNIKLPDSKISPFTTFNTPMGSISKHANEQYGFDKDSLLSQEEYDFVVKAKEIAGDSLVANDPEDGSIFAFQLVGLRTTERKVNPQTLEILNLDKNLNNIANDDNVKKISKQLGVEYVIQLKKDKLSPGDYWFNPGTYAGIDAITPSTEGFEVVLNEGDFYLYKITY